jgi:hypothetical protein
MKAYWWRIYPMVDSTERGQEIAKQVSSYALSGSETNETCRENKDD